MCPLGKHSRQVRRLLRQIYRPQHFYYIHVDQDSEYMLHQLASLAALPNIVFSSRRYASCCCNQL